MITQLFANILIYFVSQISVPFQAIEIHVTVKKKVYRTWFAAP
jgi:hypothetical protein